MRITNRMYPILLWRGSPSCLQLQLQWRYLEMMLYNIIVFENISYLSLSLSRSTPGAQFDTITITINITKIIMQVQYEKETSVKCWYLSASWHFNCHFLSWSLRWFSCDFFTVINCTPGQPTPTSLRQVFISHYCKIVQHIFTYHLPLYPQEWAREGRHW